MTEVLVEDHRSKTRTKLPQPARKHPPPGDLKLMKDLGRAIASDALNVHYQPLVNAKGRLIGFEALARWCHATLGDVPPDRFVPLAEKTGLNGELFRWVLRRACLDAAAWHNTLTVAVNISPVDLEESDVTSVVSRTLAEAGLPANQLELEVTEGALIMNSDAVARRLRELRRLGVHVALDDYGEGYSRLQYLRDFPLSKIKIDRSFVAQLGKAKRTEAIVEAVIHLGHRLGLTVAAEGVETEYQFAYLARANCDALQGYIIGRPCPIKAFAPIIANGRVPGALFSGSTRKLATDRLRARPLQPEAIPSKARGRGVL